MTTSNHKAQKLLPYLLAIVFASIAICAEAQPDLVPTRVRVTVTTLADGRCEITVSWTEANRGDQDADLYQTLVSINIGGTTLAQCGASHHLASRDRITPGPCSLRGPLPVGTVTADVIVDYNNEVSETNEANNTLEATASRQCE